MWDWLTGDKNNKTTTNNGDPADMPTKAASIDVDSTHNTSNNLSSWSFFSSWFLPKMGNTAAFTPATAGDMAERALPSSDRQNKHKLRKRHALSHKRLDMVKLDRKIADKFDKTCDAFTGYLNSIDGYTSPAALAFMGEVRDGSVVVKWVPISDEEQARRMAVWTLLWNSASKELSLEF